MPDQARSLALTAAHSIRFQGSAGKLFLMRNDIKVWIAHAQDQNG
jgi:hypothetical protein